MCGARNRARGGVLNPLPASQPIACCSYEPVGVLPRHPDFVGLARAFGCAVRQPRDLDALQADLASGFATPGVTFIELKHTCVC